MAAFEGSPDFGLRSEQEALISRPSAVPRCSQVEVPLQHRLAARADHNSLFGTVATILSGAVAVTHQVTLRQSHPASPPLPRSPPPLPPLSPPPLEACALADAGIAKPLVSALAASALAASALAASALTASALVGSALTASALTASALADAIPGSALAHIISAGTRRTDRVARTAPLDGDATRGFWATHASAPASPDWPLVPCRSCCPHGVNRAGGS